MTVSVGAPSPLKTTAPRLSIGFNPGIGPPASISMETQHSSLSRGHVAVSPCIGDGTAVARPTMMPDHSRSDHGEARHAISDVSTRDWYDSLRSDAPARVAQSAWR